MIEDERSALFSRLRVTARTAFDKSLRVRAEVRDCREIAI